MSDHKEIKAGAGYTIGNILIKGISFLSLPIFSRLLSTTEFGYFNTYVSYEAITTIVIGLGMHASIKTAYYDYKGKQNTFISTQVIIVSTVTVLLTLLYYGFHKPINTFTGFSTAITFFLIAQSFGAAMLNIVNSKLTLSYNYKSYLLYAAYNTIVNVVLSIVLIYTFLGNDRLLARVAGASIPLLTIGIVSVYRFENIKEKKYDFGMAKYALAFGLPLVWHYLSQQIQSQFDRIMITKMVDASATGIYSFIYTIANIFQILFYSTDNVWGVWMLGRMDDKDYKTIEKKASQYMLLITTIACAMMIVSKELIMIVGPSKYLRGADLFVPIILGMFFLFLYTIPVGVEYYFKETKYIGGTTFLAALVNIITNYVFIKIFGYTAAAYTTLLSYFIMFVLHWFIAKMILKKHSIQFFFNFKSFALYIFMTVTVGIGVIALNSHPIVKYGIGIIGFGILGLFTKGIWKPYLQTLIRKKDYK